jgi:hypothetical protein
MERTVTPDTLIFDLVEKLACISVSQDGHAKFFEIMYLTQKKRVQFSAVKENDLG